MASSGIRYTNEEKNWLKTNAVNKTWKNVKEFTDMFNQLFNRDTNPHAMITWLFKNKVSIKTIHTVSNYTEEMDNWLVGSYPKYHSFVELSNAFNKEFGTDYSNCRLAKHCERALKIHNPVKRTVVNKETNKKKSRYPNSGMFVKGAPGNRALPIGTIRYNSDGRPFIKVKENDGSAGRKDGIGHNYMEPYWKPLQKKIWEDHYGEVPKGYVVCSLNGNPNDTDIHNIGIIDKRGTAIMAKKGWWTDNRVMTGDGTEWCNLYYLLKDKEVLK